MKKLVSLSMLLVMSFSLYAQHQDVTRFLGIPVDGSKKDMIQKLKAKGFESIPESDMLEGEFNGTEVWIGVVTNNNKVWRVGVIDKNGRSEGDIKIRYNRLCRQFEKNSKYDPRYEGQTIPEDEDISYEMSVNKKRYQAIFYQYPVFTDSVEFVGFCRKNFNTSDSTAIKSINGLMEDGSLKEDGPLMELAYSYLRLQARLDNTIYKKLVWFTIEESYGEYKIMMFYDNEYNHDNGEDL